MAHALRPVGSIAIGLRTVTETATRLTRSNQATLRLVDPKGRGLLLAARTGDAMHKGGAGRFTTDADRSLLGWCVTHARSVRIHDADSDERFQARDGQTWMPRGVLVAPLQGRHEVIGTLSTARTGDDEYTREDLQMLELLAAFVAPHVEVEILSELATTDPLTLLRNRRYLEQRFPDAFAAALRHGRPLAVIALDLDRFKRVNDDHGHPVGDEVLTEVAKRMRMACRPTDVVARVGGEEFVILLPETDALAAFNMAKRVLGAIRDKPVLTTAKPLDITASAGVCGARPFDGLKDLVERVDDLLYQAKQDGRDRVVAELDPIRARTRVEVETQPPGGGGASGEDERRGATEEDAA